MRRPPKAPARPRRRRAAGGGDPAIVELLATDYRLWARLPPAVDAVLALGNATAADPADKMLAVVGRPVFPPGVCRTCGCSELDPCLTEDEMGFPRGCSWTDAKRTQCTVCAPPRPAGAVKARLGQAARRP